jgi:hypothetical protein
VQTPSQNVFANLVSVRFGRDSRLMVHKNFLKRTGNKSLIMHGVPTVNKNMPAGKASLHACKIDVAR